ncbi:hypothetical protein WDZ92_15730 [Nostoc sp. NIES-2111]
MLIPASGTLLEGLQKQRITGDLSLDQIEVEGRAFRLASIRSKERSGTDAYLSAYLVGHSGKDCALCSVIFERIQKQFGLVVEELKIAELPVFYDHGPEFSPILIPVPCSTTTMWCESYSTFALNRNRNVFHRQMLCRRVSSGPTCEFPYPDAME